MERSGAKPRFRRAGLQFAIEVFELREHPAHPQNSVPAVKRAAAVGGAAVGGYFDPRKSLMAGSDNQVGWLGDDSRVGISALHQGVGSKARVFLVGNSGQYQSARFDAAGGR